MLNENLIELSELMQLLGYGDERSIRKWCKNNSIPIIKLGLKKYVLSHLLTQYIDNQCVIFVKGKRSTTNQELKQSQNTTNSNTRSTQKAYNPNNELISKYLSKYESDNKSKTAKKTTP